MYTLLVYVTDEESTVSINWGLWSIKMAFKEEKKEVKWLDKI